TALRSVATPSSREARWQAQDDALEAECHTLHVGSDDGGRKDYEPIADAETARTERVLDVLEEIPAEAAIVLRAVYGGEPNAYADVYDAEFGGIVGMTPTVQAERQRRAEAGAHTTGSGLRTRGSDRA